MFVRFVIADLHHDSHKGMGVSQAVFALRDAGELHEYEDDLVRQVSDWFNENLEKPSRFTNAKPPYYRRSQRAISWFKESATAHIAMIRHLAAILENHGTSVQMITTDKPGYIVYEDEHQVVAEPFSDTRA
jgi:hypothetical protein